MLNNLMDSLNVRRGIRTFIAIFISTCIYRYFHVLQGFWIPLTTMIVMQPTIAATLRKGFQRLLGTIIGILLASFLVFTVHNPYWLDALLVFSLFFAYYMKAFNLVNYGIFVATLSIMVAFLVSVLVPQESTSLILARIYDTILGALVGIAVTFLIFPNDLKQDVDKNRLEIIRSGLIYFRSIIIYFIEPYQGQNHLKNLKKEHQESIVFGRLLYPNLRYEFKITQEGKIQYHTFLLLAEKMWEFLSSLENLMLYAKPSQEILEKLSYPLQLISQKTDFSHELRLIEEIKNSTIKEEDRNFAVTLHADIKEYEEVLKLLMNQCHSRL